MSWVVWGQTPSRSLNVVPLAVVLSSQSQLLGLKYKKANFFPPRFIHNISYESQLCEFLEVLRKISTAGADVAKRSKHCRTNGRFREQCQALLTLTESSKISYFCKVENTIEHDGRSRVSASAFCLSMFAAVERQLADQRPWR